MNQPSLDTFCACCGDGLGRQTPGQDVCARCEHLGCRPDQGQPRCFGAGCVADDLGGIPVAAGDSAISPMPSEPPQPDGVTRQGVKWRHGKGLPILEPQRASYAVGTVEDGFGNVWGPCSTCGAPMQVVRPGKAQCVYCEDLYTRHGAGAAR